MQKGIITEGIQSNIWIGIDNAIQQNNLKVYSKLEGFIINILSLCVQQKSLVHFDEYISFPYIIYSKSFKNRNKNTSLEQAHSFFSESSSSMLRRIISFHIGFEFKQNIKNLSTLENLNNFYYSAYRSYGFLLYYMVRNIDLNQFKYAIEEYDQIFEADYYSYFDKSYNKEESDLKDNEHKIRSQFYLYRRHVLVGVKYWIYFMYQLGLIDEDTTIKFLDQLHIYYIDSHDILNDILLFRRNDMYDYMDWTNWDYTERRSGKIYSPPSPSYWLVLGFLLDQIRYKRTLYINLDNFTAKELSDAEFLFDRLKEVKRTIILDFEKWKKILNLTSLEDIETQIDKILNAVSTLKRVNRNNSDNQIAQSPLSENKIKKFKNIVGQAWKTNARISKLFKTFGKVSDNLNPTESKKIGQTHFFENAKMMFIDGDLYQEIYGVDQMGGIIGRWEDDLFVETAIKSVKVKVTDSKIEKVLNKAIYELKENGFQPSIILMSPDYRIQRELYNNKLFVAKHIQKHPIPELDTEYAGTYDGIPIFTSFSEILKNKVIVSDFKEAFKMNYSINSNWVYNELLLNVREVSNEEAQIKLQQNPSKWLLTDDKFKLSDEEALTKIKTSIFIDIYSTKDFEIVNNEAYSVGFIVPNDND